MGANKSKLNERQWDVLRWVVEGCPDREWPDSTYKTTAVALQSRRLVRVSRRGGVWSVALTEAGSHFLQRDGNGKVVASASTSRLRITKPKPKSEATAAADQKASAQSEPGAAHSNEQPDITPPLTPTRALLRDIAAADGELHRNVKDDKTNYTALVAIINTRDMAPEGTRVVIDRGDSYEDRIFRLEPKPRWTTMPPRDVVAAERIRRWNKVVAELRDRKRSFGMTKEVAARALRILQSLAAEADARGHSVEHSRVSTDRNGFTHREDEGQLVILVRNHRFAIWLIQREDHSPHVPTPEEVKRQAQLSWSVIPKWDKTPGRRLQLRLYKPESRRWHDDWNDTKTLSVRVEDHLPEVMYQIETTADAIDARAAAEREEYLRAQERRARAESLIGDRHAEVVRERVLLDRAQQLEQVRQVRDYVEELVRYVEGTGPDEDSKEAEEWLKWCRSYLVRADPFSRPVRMPTIPAPTWEEHANLMKVILNEMLP